MNLTSTHPLAIGFANLLAEREGELHYADLSDEFLGFVERDGPETRDVLRHLGVLLFFYKHKDDQGRCVLDLEVDAKSIYGESGLVAAFRIYCMLEHFTRKGWIRCRVGEFSVLDTIDQPRTRIDLTLTEVGLKAGNSILWRSRLRTGGRN